MDNETGYKGTYCRVPINELRVDDTYQRGEYSVNNTAQLARDFRWEAFGTITVMRRANGSHFVVDGHQRLLALRKRKYTGAVPCMVWASDGASSEAKAFEVIATRRHNLSAIDKYRAALVYGDPICCSVECALKKIGMRVGRTAKHDHNVVDFVACILDTWEKQKEEGPAWTIRSLELQRQIIGDAPMCRTIHKGLYWLFMGGVPVELYVSKLASLGGKVALNRSIAQYRILAGREAESYKMCGEGILQLINKGLVKKVHFNYKSKAMGARYAGKLPIYQTGQEADNG